MSQRGGVWYSTLRRGGAPIPPEASKEGTREIRTAHSDITESSKVTVCHSGQARGGATRTVWAKMLCYGQKKNIARGWGGGAGGSLDDHQRRGRGKKEAGKIVSDVGFEVRF